jgi:hypothetical protein
MPEPRWAQGGGTWLGLIETLWAATCRMGSWFSRITSRRAILLAAAQQGALCGRRVGRRYLRAERPDDR